VSLRTLKETAVARVAVIGAAGYSGGEFARLALDHPGIALEALVVRSRESEAQAPKSLAIVTNRPLIDDQIEFPVALYVLHSTPALDGGIGFFRKGQLDECQRSPVACKSSDEHVGIMRKKKVTDDDAKRAAAQRKMRLFKSGQSGVTR